MGGWRYDSPIASGSHLPPLRVVLFVALWLIATAFLVFGRSPSCTFSKLTSGDRPGTVCASVDRPTAVLELLPTGRSLRAPAFAAQALANMAWFALPAFVACRRRRPGGAGVAVFLIAFSAFVEVMQTLFFRYRHGSVFDFACNVAGVMLGWALAIRLANRSASRIAARGQTADTATAHPATTEP